MQGYLNHFLGNMDIINSREVVPNKHNDQRAYWQKYKTICSIGNKLPFAYQIEFNINSCSQDNFSSRSCWKLMNYQDYIFSNLFRTPRLRAVEGSCIWIVIPSYKFSLVYCSSPSCRTLYLGRNATPTPKWKKRKKKKIKLLSWL